MTSHRNKQIKYLHILKTTHQIRSEQYKNQRYKSLIDLLFIFLYIIHTIKNDHNHIVYILCKFYLTICKSFTYANIATQIFVHGKKCQKPLKVQQFAQCLRFNNTIACMYDNILNRHNSNYYYHIR